MVLKPGVVLVSTTPFAILKGLSSGELKLNSFYYQALSSLVETLVFNQHVVTIADFTGQTFEQTPEMREFLHYLKDRGCVSDLRFMRNNLRRDNVYDEYMRMTRGPVPNPYVANLLAAEGYTNRDPESRERLLNNAFMYPTYQLFRKDQTDLLISRDLHYLSLRMEDVTKKRKRISLSTLSYVLGEPRHTVRSSDAFLKLILSTGVQIHTDVISAIRVALSLSPCSLRPPGLHYDLYKEIERKYRYYLEKLHNYAGSARIFAPPLTAIVLGRCKDKRDIPEQIIKLKAEFSEVSRTTERFQEDLRRAKVFGDIVEVVNEFESGWAVLMNRIGRKGQRTSIIRKVWDVVKAVNPARMATEVLDQIYKADEESQLMLRFHTFYDLWRNLEKLPDERSLIRKVFKDDVDFSDLPVNLSVARFADACHFGEHPGF